MNSAAFEKLQSQIERLQKEVIGSPVWIKNKHVFEYPAVDIKVVAILKAIRAVQGLKALHLLCANGLFIDMGAIFRCIMDCEYEIYFLLEKYPEQSENVTKFVTAFSQTTIVNHLAQSTVFPPSKKIYAAAARVVSMSKQDQNTTDMLNRIYTTFCGYTHANYSHIMQIYGGSNWKDVSFNIGGVPSDMQKMEHMQLVDEVVKSLSSLLKFMGLKFNVKLE